MQASYLASLTAIAFAASAWAESAWAESASNESASARSAWSERAATLLPGDPITAETVASHAELIRIADALDAAVDTKDWALARSFFADEVADDFTSLVGGDPAIITAATLIAAWSSNLTAEKTSFHLRGNHRITFTDPRSATTVSHGYAWNRMDRGALPENGGDPMWEVWGAYEHVFEATDEGWRLTGMTFFATAERGDAFVRNTPGG